MKTQKLAVATVWMAAACFGAEPKLTVVIFDFAGTPMATLKAAAETAHDAFRLARVETEWSVCRASKDATQHCTLPPDGSYLQVEVLTSATEGGLSSHEGLGYAIMCHAFQQCAMSYAFYLPAQALALRAGRPVSAALAVVIAHEVGHLLGMRHSASGIMKAEFTSRDIQDAAAGQLRFPDKDAGKLRAAAEECEAAMSAVR